MKKLLLPFAVALVCSPVFAAVPDEVSDEMLSLVEMAAEIGGSFLVAVIAISAIFTLRKAA